MGAQGVKLAVVVTPRSGKDAVDGWRGDELVVRVTAPPDEGRANAAVCKTVASALRVPKSSVTVERGGSSRHKILRVNGVSAAELDAALGRPAGDP